MSKWQILPFAHDVLTTASTQAHILLSAKEYVNTYCKHKIFTWLEKYIFSMFLTNYVPRHYMHSHMYLVYSNLRLHNGV